MRVVTEAKEEEEEDEEEEDGVFDTPLEEPWEESLVVSEEDDWSDSLARRAVTVFLNALLVPLLEVEKTKEDEGSVHRRSNNRHWEPTAQSNVVGVVLLRVRRIGVVWVVVVVKDDTRGGRTGVCTTAMTSSNDGMRLFQLE